VADRRIVALDGIRGLAVLGVLLFHADLLRGGWVGVDVFFVLSGFLITGLLLDEHREWGTVSLRGFWARRVRRLVPALLVVLAAVVVAWTAMARATDALRGDVLATLGYVANWHFIDTDQSYFASFEASPLRHAWSLSIEEQFYVVWPLAFLGLVRLRRPLALALLLVAVAASTWWMHHVAADPGQLSRAYYGSDTRASAILLGCAAALGLDALRRTRPWTVDHVLRRVSVPLVAAAGLALAAVAVAVPEDARWLYRNGGFTLVGLAAAALVVAVPQLPRGRLRRFLRGPGIVRLGLISYGLYLWHWPVALAVGELDLPRAVALFAQLIIPVLLAEISFRLVEQPIRRVRLRRPAFATLSGAAMVAGLTVAATTQAAAPALIPEEASGMVVAGARQPPSRPAPLMHATRTAPATTEGRVPSTRPRIIPWALVRDRGTTTTANPTTTSTTSTTTPLELPLDVAVLGDSVAWTVASNPAPDAPLRVRGYWHARCDIVGDRVITGDHANDADPNCPSWPEGWRATLAERADAVVVVLGLRQLFDLEVDGVRLPVGSPAWEEHYRAAVARALGVVRAETSAPVLWFDVPCYTWEQEGTGGEEHDERRLRVVNRVLRDALAADPRVRVVDYAERVCDGTASDPALRPDGAHLTREAARELWRWLTPMILEDVARHR